MSLLLERLRAALAADYALLEEIGGGGMGLVFRARDLQLDKTVATADIPARTRGWRLARKFVWRNTLPSAGDRFGHRPRKPRTQHELRAGVAGREPDASRTRRSERKARDDATRDLDGCGFLVGRSLHR
jgi:hypothetical protein